MWSRTLRLALLVAFLSVVPVSHYSPAAPPAGTIRIASWNVLNLYPDTPFANRARVIAQYDIVALQEVKSLARLDDLRAAVEKQTGAPWKAAVSRKVGKGDAYEYATFLYRSDRVQEVKGPRGVYPQSSSRSFSRSPFYATFRAGQFDFTLITVHVTFATPESKRTREVQRLKNVWLYVQSRDPKENDLLLMGDFNRNRPTHAAFAPLRDELKLAHLIAGDNTTFTTYSNRSNQVGAAWYDNIWMDAGYTGREYAGHSGIDYTYKRFYTHDPHPHLKVRTTISDHCPVWAEFSTAGPDDD
ncbi:MAG: endonuclease/exonuclease/phosphatase family protein [Armatimonadota bacterium]